MQHTDGTQVEKTATLEIPLDIPLEDTIERVVRRNLEMRAFLLSLLNPEELGHAVTGEVRERAAVLLGIKP